LHFDAQWRWKQLINGLGAVTTAVVMLIFAITKFRDGAWIILLLTPALIWFFFRIHRHYKEVAHQLSLAGVIKPIAARPVQTLVLVDNLHASSIRALNFAMALGQPITAVHISIDEGRTQDLQRKWQERMEEWPLLILSSPYRSLTEPLVEYIAQLRRDQPDIYIHLILGTLAAETFWEQILHRNSTLVFRLALRHFDGIVITTVPFQLHHELNWRASHE
jgi:hypothetical protein